MNGLGTVEIDPTWARIENALEPVETLPTA
jgi:hypothetical protein